MLFLIDYVLYLFAVSSLIFGLIDLSVLMGWTVAVVYPADLGPQMVLLSPSFTIHFKFPSPSAASSVGLCDLSGSIT